MKTIFVLVDALKSTYLTEENMPFLYNLSRENFYVKEIIPCAGFCERSEIFTGLDGYDTGNFTAIGFSKENSPYISDKYILKLASLSSSILPSLTKRIFQKWRRKAGRRLNCYRIPYQSLSNFALTEDGLIKFTEHNSIFDVLDSTQKSYTMNAFTALSDLKPRTTKEVVEFSQDEISKNTYFIPLYIGKIDTVGHKYGADIVSIRPYLQEVDGTLCALYKIASDKGYNFCVLGDHGMVPITHKINIMEAVSKCKLTHGTDYEAFYDSTMVRFWFYNDKSRVLIVSLLSAQFSEYGFIVNPNSAKQYRIPLDIVNQKGVPLYGDIIWCANPGVLVSPDYFHPAEASENGMHGYIKVIHGDGTGLYVATNKQGCLDEMHSSRVCYELCESLEIEVPNYKNWKRAIL